MVKDAKVDKHNYKSCMKLERGSTCGFRTNAEGGVG